MNFLQWMGGFIQQTATTNTAGEIAGSIADIRYNHKRKRGIWCLSLAIAGAGGGAALFVLEPSILSYFKPIVLQSFPFLGNIVSTVAVGILGGWFGGGFGHNIGKETAREYSERILGHPNSAYTFTDADVQKIIDQNPLVFNYDVDADTEQGINQEDILGLKAQDTQELKNLLLFLRSQIDAHRKDGTTAHDDYKFAFLSAVRDFNLIPVLELFAKNDAKREVRKQLATSIASYMAHVDPSFIEQQAPRPLPLNPFHQNNNNHDDDVEPAFAVQEQNRGIELEDVAAADHITFKGTPLYANLSRYINALNDTKSKKTNITRTKPASTVDAQHPLQNHQKRELLVQLRTAYHTQQQKQANVQPLATPLARTLRSGRRH